MAAAARLFPAYDETVFQHHLKTMEPEVFDTASGLMVITYQTFVVRHRAHHPGRHLYGREQGPSAAVRLSRQGALAQ